MASPYSTGPSGGAWSMGTPPAQPPPAESGPQFRPMGVKVLYSLKDSQDNCLARCPGVQQIQTVPLDEANSIGVIDLRVCLLAIAQCSPEMVGQLDVDYTVYALDYSEPDTPLVGQGMLSWGLEPAQPNEEPKMVTGRVTRNMMGLFGGGPREMLEVKLKLASVPRMRRPADYAPAGMEPLQHHPQPPPARHASTPTDTAEWGSFVQANPTLSRSNSMDPAPQFAPMTSRPENVPQPYQGPRPASVPLCPVPPAGPAHAASFPPAIAPAPAAGAAHGAMLPQSEANYSDGPLPQLQPRPATPGAPEARAVPIPKPSRPSSRASRSRAPTGRPRGRPKKKVVADGNTSAAEDPTDADDGPQKKRAKTTKADWSDNKAPLDATADSLRIAAATSGALRTMRPAGAAGSEGGIVANHLQEGPRAPTPVPQASNLKKSAPARKRLAPTTSRRESMASLDGSSSYPAFPHDPSMLVPSPQPLDARSPTDSIAPSDQAYTPEDSPAEVGSSPPVPRSTAFIRSSPMPSSPILPALPPPQPDSGFMSGGVDSFLDEEDSTQPQDSQPWSRPADNPAQQLKIAKPVPKRGGRQKYIGFPFQEENPGPPELLPLTSLYNPPPHHRKKVETEAAVPRLNRANTEPNLNSTEQANLPCPTPNPLLPLPQPAPSETPEPPLPTVEEPDKALSQILEAAIAATPLLEPAVETSLVLTDCKEQPVPTGEPPSAPEPELPTMKPPQSSGLSGSEALNKTVSVPASDPVSARMLLTLPQVSFSEAPCPPSDVVMDSSASNKNFVKKQSIKERLAQAVASGEMPPFCTNCGAVETPTWRKMWTQVHSGTPGSHDFSEKPGHVTALDILTRDGDGAVLTYRLVKKTLGSLDDKQKWNELLLCNPCGIWLGKFKTHRPPDRWDRDASRLNQPRKRRDPKNAGNGARSKKQRTKSDAAAPNPTSEAYYMTDPLGPGDEQAEDGGSKSSSQDAVANNAEASQPPVAKDVAALGPSRSPNAQGPGSSHSRGSGTAQSPIPLDDDLGQTRRLLFPSPRKDGIPKVLGEVAVNIVKTGPVATALKDKDKATTSSGKEVLRTPATPSEDRENDDMLGLFGTPLNRPSTPPPGGAAATGGPFKTPTRPTPSHRPITRSVSKSIRSALGQPGTPSQALAALQRTPSRTPGSSARHREALNQAQAAIMDGSAFGALASPFTASVNHLLYSEAHDFTLGSPSHDLIGLDLSSIANIDSDGNIQGPFDGAGALDFGQFLTADGAPMPSSPPLRGGVTSHPGTDSLDNSWELWAQLGSDAVTPQLDDDTQADRAQVA